MKTLPSAIDAPSGATSKEDAPTHQNATDETAAQTKGDETTGDETTGDEAIGDQRADGRRGGKRRGKRDGKREGKGKVGGRRGGKLKGLKRGPQYHLARASDDDITQSAGDASLRATYLGLDEKVRGQSVDDLNRILIDTIMLRDMYKKHHWQMSGITFYQLHLLFDAHYEQQVELVDLLAERVQLLGGVSVAMPRDVAERTNIAHPPTGREAPSVQITRLIKAHRTILEFCHEVAARAAKLGDDRTNDVVVSDVIAINEKQVWFLAEHLVPSELQGHLKKEDWQEG